MDQKKLSQLAVNDQFEGFLIIKSIAVKTGQTGKNYLDLTVSDGDAKLNAKIWDYSEERYAQYVPNCLVKVRGTVVAWQNSLQMRIERIRLAMPEDPVKIEDFVPSAPMTGENMLRQVKTYANSIEDEDLKKIVHYILEKYEEKLLYWPAAAANHHSVRGGLLYHTLTMLKAGQALCSVYKNLDTDWVFAGVILHDIEKIHELEANELGLVSSYTKEGMLLGHLVQATITVAEAGKAVGADEETIALLQHLIIAHHYEPEFGSPRKPMFLEAELVHYLDIIDARMYDFTSALADIPEGTFTEKQWLLDNRRLYKKKSKKK